MKNSLYLLILVVWIGCSQKKTTEYWHEYDSVLAEIKTPEFPDRLFNIKDFGAINSGICSQAINKAINACHEQGGGVVFIPEGEYYTGPIKLLSNVNLHISEKAVLKFSTDPEEYMPPVISRWEGMDCYNISPLIYASNQKNIAISGKGILDGQATRENWWKWTGRQPYVTDNGEKREGGKTRIYQLLADSVPFEKRIFTTKDQLKPPFIQLYKCENILIEDITLNRSPFWLIHPVFSKNITIRKVTMDSHGPNNDGCDPESCQNVLIENCLFNTGDDCIAIKSGRNSDGRYWNRPSENIIIRNCVMKNGHAGVAIGSEISGGFRNLWVENCEMDSPHLDRGIRIKSNAHRGGRIENIYVRDINVKECRQAIFKVEMKYENVTEGKHLPSVRNIFMENIQSNKSQYAIFIDDLEDGCVRNVYFKNCTFDGINDSLLNIIPETLNITFENIFFNGNTFSH